MLKGKTALVTGSTSGIGLATARALAADGADIMLNGFGEAAAIEKERAGLEKEFGIKALYSPADMSKPAEIADMIKTTEKSFGSLMWRLGIHSREELAQQLGRHCEEAST